MRPLKRSVLPAPAVSACVKAPTFVSSVQRLPCALLLEGLRHEWPCLRPADCLRTVNVLVALWLSR